MAGLALFLALWFGVAPQTPAPGEVIFDIRVHGNHLTSDVEVIQLSGLKKGDPVTATTVETATRALERSGKFDDVQVLKRFGSIDDPTQIVIMLVVNEGPVKIELPDAPGAAPKIVSRGFLGRLMYLPILDAEDGYALKFGVNVAYVPSGKSHTRVSMPLTWGGERRAGLEWERTFTYGRLQVGGAFTSSKHPFYEVKDERRRGWARAEVSVSRFHVGGTATAQRVNFGGVVDQVTTVGGDVTLDTRLDPLQPRNALFVVAKADQVRVTPDGGTARDPYVRTSIDATGYLGLIRQTVLVARVVRADATASQPSYFKNTLGGMPNLRGFDAARWVGDSLVAGTLELRIPVTPPLNVGKTGFRVFYDAGTVYDKGQRYADQTLKRGYGAGLFLNAAVFQINLDVAHGQGAGTRFLVGGGFSF